MVGAAAVLTAAAKVRAVVDETFMIVELNLLTSQVSKNRIGAHGSGH